MIRFANDRPASDLLRLTDERGRMIGVVRRPTAPTVIGRGAGTVYAMPALRLPSVPGRRLPRAG
ncbi:MAG: hypothetical protein ACREMH_09285 [Gemmatimonadales bacterium]